MARPRKVIDISTGKIGKAKRSARQENEKKFKLPRDALAPPDWMEDERAREEFMRVVTECAKIDILDNLDLAILAIYSNSYANYVQASNYINTSGPIVFKENAYGKYQAESPWVDIQAKYAKQIMQCSTKLGMATTDRLKLVVPVKEEKAVNKYLKYLEG